MRVKITKTYKDFKQGETMEVTPNVAFDLMDRGVAIITKDITFRDLSTKKGKRWQRS